MQVSSSEHVVSLELQNDETDFVNFYLYSSLIDDETEVQRMVSIGDHKVSEWRERGHHARPTRIMRKDVSAT